MRFSFKWQAIAAVVALGLIAAFLGMGGGSASGPATSPSGDTYVEAMIGAPRFVNPLLAVSDTDTDLAHLVFSGLTRVDQSGNIVPDLAASVDASSDATVYTFTLRSNLRWHDGEPVTADDAYFTLGTLLQATDFPGDPTLAAPWHGVSIKVSSPNTIVFTLPAPDASFVQYTTIGLLPRHLWGNTKPSSLYASELNLAPVGSGPWRYADRRNNSAAPSSAAPDDGDAAITDTIGLGTGAQPSNVIEGVLLEPNPYAQTPTPAHAAISRIWFRPYPNFGAALTGLRLGEVHGLGHIPTESLSEVEALEGVSLHRQTLARYSMLLFNVQTPLLQAAETRQAIEYAIDKETLGGPGSATGEARPAQGPILPHSWAFDPTLQRRVYNATEAARLLDSAGWKMADGGVRVRDGVTLTVVLAVNKDVPANVEVAEHISAELHAVGVDVQTALVGRDTFLRDYLGPRAFHLALAGWEARGADPDIYAYWHSSQAATGGLNFSGWTNAAADKALLDARATTDRAARARLYADFQRAFALDPPASVLYNPLYVYATRDPASGVTLPDADLLSPAQRFDTIGSWALER